MHYYIMNSKNTMIRKYDFVWQLSGIDFENISHRCIEDRINKKNDFLISLFASRQINETVICYKVNLWDICYLWKITFEF